MKILLITCGVNNEEMLTIKNGVALVKKYFPDFQFFYQTTDRQFSSLPFKNDVAQGYVLNNSEVLELVPPDNTFDIATLIYDWNKVNPKPTNPATSLMKKNNCIPIAMPKQWFMNYPEVFCQFFLHELLHAESFRDGVKDLTHDFYVSAYSQKQPTDYYVALLKPLLQDVVRKATIYRYEDDGKNCLGRLSASVGNANFNCDTLENSIKKIPKGTYLCKWTFSPKFMKFTYELSGVKGRTGIRFHAGSFFTDSEGCLMLGSGLKDLNKDGKLDIIQSRATITSFNGFFSQYPFTLTIV